MVMAALPQSNATERLTWSNAVERMDWRQGEHVTLIGPTGRGKTELTIKLLDHRRYVVFLGTKREDETQDRLKDMGYRTITSADGLNIEIAPKFILRPKFPRKITAKEIKELHSDIFREGLMRAYAQTRWTVAMDEARYICDYLGLRDEAQLLWLQGRSQRNSIICNTQRSRFVPLEAYDQATHLFLWTDPDLGNISRNSELAGFNREAVLDVMPTMSKHDVLYVNTVTSDMFITNTRWE